MKEPYRLVDSLGRPTRGEFLLDLTGRHNGERSHIRIKIDDVNVAQDLLTEIEKLRGWIAKQPVAAPLPDETVTGGSTDE